MKHKFKVWDSRCNEMLDYDYIMSKRLNQGGNHLVYNILCDQKRYNVLMCLGLLDKNNKEIYEGDIVKHLGYEVRNGKQIRPERFHIIGVTSSFITDCYHVQNLIETGTVEVIENKYEKSGIIL